MNDDPPGGYTWAARVTTGFDGGNHPLHGDVARCTRCGALLLPADSGRHDMSHAGTQVMAMYVTLRAGEVARTVECGDSAHVDVDADGRVIGVEVIGGTRWTDVLVGLAAEGKLRIS